MKKTMSKITIFVISTVMLLSGCNVGFNPSLYIQTSLNAIYKGDFTRYTSIVNLPIETAQTNYENGYKSQVDTFAKMYSMVDNNDIVSLNDTMRKHIERMYKEIYAQTFYSVSKESKAVQNGYEVEVNIKPLKLFVASSNEINEFVNQFNSNITAGTYNDTNEYSDEVLNNDVYAKGICDIIENHLKSPQYGNLKTIKVKVMHNAEKNIYYINTDDLKHLNEVIIELPNSALL